MNLAYYCRSTALIKSADDRVAKTPRPKGRRSRYRCESFREIPKTRWTPATSLVRRTHLFNRFNAPEGSEVLPLKQPYAGGPLTYLWGWEVDATSLAPSRAKQFSNRFRNAGECLDRRTLSPLYYCFTEQSPFLLRVARYPATII